jgi:hypothetical protein
MKLYLAGPMRGYPEYNFPAFHAMSKRLRAAGHDVYSPAEADEKEDKNTSKIAPEEAEAKFAYYLSRDIGAIARQKAVAVLPGWEKSSGAKLEVHFALLASFPVFDAEQLANGHALPLELKPDVRFVHASVKEG